MTEKTEKNPESWVLVSDEILGTVPEGARLIKTKDEDGQVRWKKPKDVMVSDQVAVKDGLPVVMLKAPGRPKKELAAIREHASLGGAPRKVKRREDRAQGAPLSQIQAQRAKEAEARIRRQAFYAKDALLQTVLENPDSESVLAITLKEFAVEAASLAYDRLRAERAGNSKDSSQLSIRRLKALEGLASNWLKRADRLGQRTIDLNSPVFLALLEFLLKSFQEAMSKGGVSGDQIQTTLTELSTRFGDETWIKEAKHVMSQAPR